MEAIREVLTDEQWAQFQQPTQLRLRAGECAFHHALTVHGSFANRTPRPRRAAVLNVVRDGVCSDDDQPLLAGTPALGRGRPLGGQFFPLLCDADGRYA
jgi:ectoine hydroxylase-related dioxygenase (phytanoyl-CoA dioxygenase family)